MTITDVQGQTIIGTVEKVYSTRFEGKAKYESRPLTFCGSGGSWGNVILKKGERALVFLSFLNGSNMYYQDHWRGHFSIVEKDKEFFAVANWHMLEEKDAACVQLRQASFLLDPNIPWRVAIPYPIFENELLKELSEIENDTREVT